MSRWPAWNELAPPTRLRIEGQLTSRQLEVFKLAGAGYGIRRTAAALNINESTVKGHLLAIGRRLTVLKEAA